MNAPPCDLTDGLVWYGPGLDADGWNDDALCAALDSAPDDPSSGRLTGVVLAPPRDPDYSHAAANDRVAAAVRRDPARRRQLARVDPNHRGAVDELRRCIDELGVTGLYLSPREECFPITGVPAARVLAVAAEASLPVVVETGTPWVSEPHQVALVAARHPHLPLVMTNGGQLNISGLGQADAFEVLRSCGNLRIHTTGVYRQDFLEASLAEFGAERVLFASGAPRFDLGYEAARVFSARCDDDVRRIAAGLAVRGLFW